MALDLRRFLLVTAGLTALAAALLTRRRRPAPASGPWQPLEG